MLVKPALWSACRMLLAGTMLAVFCQSAAAAVATWKGETPEVKLGSDAEIRVSVLGFTEPDKGKAVVEQYQQYLANHNAQALTTFLQQLDTKGYLFTKEAVGYSIKYAWQSDDKADKRIVLLVTPALKTRNPYQWQQANTSAEPFTLIELKLAGEDAQLTTSLDTPVEINAQGQLQLKATGKSSVFARLKDDTPYYLKGKP